MADTTKDIWNDDDGEEQKPKKRRKLPGILLFFLTLAAVLGIVLVAAYRDGTGFDVLRRYFSYSREEKTSGNAGYDYDASASNRFAALGDTLVVLSNTSLRLLGQDGEEVWSANVQMESPALSTGGGRAVAYDVGGRELYVLDAEGLVSELRAEEEEPFIAASLNEKGWMAVTAEKQNYKACVSVYNAKLEKVFDFNSSRRFVADACVTDDCAFLAAVTLGQEDGTFVSNVVLYDLTQTEPVADYSVRDGLVMCITQQNGTLVTVSDNKLTFADTGGQIAGEYDYTSSYLREYDCGGDGYTVLLLNRYQSGSVGRLVTVGTGGEELASLDVHEEVLSVSAVGRYIAVLYTDSLVVYNPDLQAYATLKGTGYAKEALVRADGSALLIASESARLFLP